MELSPISIIQQLCQYLSITSIIALAGTCHTIRTRLLALRDDILITHGYYDPPTSFPLLHSWLLLLNMFDENLEHVPWQALIPRLRHLGARDNKLMYQWTYVNEAAHDSIVGHLSPFCQAVNRYHHRCQRLKLADHPFCATCYQE